MPSSSRSANRARGRGRSRRAGSSRRRRGRIARCRSRRARPGRAPPVPTHRPRAPGRSRRRRRPRHGRPGSRSRRRRRVDRLFQRRQVVEPGTRGGMPAEEVFARGGSAGQLGIGGIERERLGEDGERAGVVTRGRERMGERDEEREPVARLEPERGRVPAGRSGGRRPAAASTSVAIASSSPRLAQCSRWRSLAGPSVSTAAARSCAASRQPSPAVP